MNRSGIVSIRNLCFLCLTCLFAAAWGSYYKSHAVPVSLMHSSGAANRAMERSEPLCQAMARPGERLKLTAEYLLAGKFPSRCAVYAVDCVSEGGRVVAHLWWDTTAGQLQEVSAEMPLQPVSSRTSLISERTALIDARRWLRIAGLDVPGSNWRFWRPTCSESSFKTWTVVAASYGEQLIFHLNGLTGGLIGLSIGKE